MPQTEITDIHDFAAKTRMLIKKMDELKAERDALMAEINEKNEKINELNVCIAEKDEKYKILNTAKMLNITDENIEDTRKQINEMIRTVNQCITLLSEK
ncbi:MAG: hypothetical protein IKQ68_05625 [Prevotella sp.]|nr:hypothetical protein [Prevotella sp.]